MSATYHIFSYVYLLVLFLGGKSLPIACNPSSSQRNGELRSPKQKKPGGINSRQYSGKRRKDIIDALKAQEAKDEYKPMPGSESIS